MKFLLFEYKYTGHYIEYIRYIVNHVSHKNVDIDLSLYLAPEYKCHFDKGDFKCSDNIHQYYLTHKEIKQFRNSGYVSALIGGFLRCKLLKRIIKKSPDTKIILLSSNDYITGLPLIIPKHCDIRSIEYIIPKRNEDVSIFKRIAYGVKMRLYAGARQLKKIYLLNDEQSVAYYCECFRTNKFRYIPDPIVKLYDESHRINNSSDKTDNLSDNKINILQAGFYSSKKGVFKVLDAFDYMSESELKQLRFILCGKCTVKSEEKEIARRITELSQKMEVVFFDKFVDDSVLHSLYQMADIIMLPYENHAQSSGNLGHAASYETPVIGPSKGLLGHLIRKYNLGITLDDIDGRTIADAIREVIKTDIKNRGESTLRKYTEYTRRCSPELFLKTILEE